MVGLWCVISAPTLLVLLNPPVCHTRLAFYDSLSRPTTTSTLCVCSCAPRLSADALLCSSWVVIVFLVVVTVSRHHTGLGI